MYSMSFSWLLHAYVFFAFTVIDSEEETTVNKCGNN